MTTMTTFAATVAIAVIVLVGIGLTAPDCSGGGKGVHATPVVCE